eukprot:TRINITY_DN20255_c0_g1_i4.p1 TRINITY_DN20255_c0_g1~~TRINITY_DN20255_c0_g1_i4.p1  ORF type:complete len:343 (+),score=52.37 TRINITY_DN20255_c0_g1_i4:79-1107(+)
MAWMLRPFGCTSCAVTCCHHGETAELPHAQAPPLSSQAVIGDECDVRTQIKQLTEHERIVGYPGDDLLADCCEKSEQDLEDGVRYRGQWYGKQPHGSGTISRSDGSYYEGQFRFGSAHGQGKHKAANGNVYEGEWRQDLAHGRGKYMFHDGSCYEGEWHSDEMHGRGVERWADGARYEGLYYRGVKHGQGVYTSPAGAVIFEGQFHADKKHGYGKYHFENGRTYDGQWLIETMHGHGKLTWPDGSYYTGEFVRGVRSGEGILEWKDGRRYKGQWADGKQHGWSSLVVEYCWVALSSGREQSRTQALDQEVTMAKMQRSQLTSRPALSHIQHIYAPVEGLGPC